MKSFEHHTSPGTDALHSLFRKAVAAVALVTVAGITVAMATENPGKVQRLALSKASLWINSGVWQLGSSNALLLVDALSSRVHEFQISPSKGKLEAVGFLKDPSSSFAKPSIIQTAGTGYLLETEGKTFVRLSQDLEVVSSVDLEEKTKGTSLGQIRSAYAWAPLSENVLLTYSDVLRNDGTWISAFLRVPLENPQAFQILRPVPLDSPARTFYLLGYPYVAATSSGKGYFVDMGNTPTLYEAGLTGSPKPVKVRNSRDLLRRAELPKKEGLKSAEVLFDRLQQSALPAAIYGGDALYLLSREPAGKDATSWTLARFDEGSGAFLPPYKIPTKAAHLTVIPGDTFAILEKGRVEGVGIQAIPSVLLIPKKVIDAAH